VEDRISELEDKMEITDSIKEQTWGSWTLKKKRCKQEGIVIYSTK
jgi:hypothetical protein